MSDAFISLLREWITEAEAGLAEQGWIVRLDECAGEDAVDGVERLTVELENRSHHGRFALEDTGRTELGAMTKADGTLRRGECDVHTAGQLEDAIRQFLEWIGWNGSGDARRVNDRVCPHGKKIYGSRPEARTVVELITGRTRMPNNITEYQCPVCHGWHIGGLYGRIGVKRRSFPN